MGYDIDKETVLTNYELSNEMIGNIQLSELPSIINSQVVEINDLGAKIESAVEKANSAKEKALEAEDLKYKIGHRGEMVTTIRDVTVKLAESQSETTEALNLSFKYEKKLGDITKSLFALGMYSLAHTEVVIQRLSDELKNEGKSEKLSDVAKQRLREVIEQLEAQKKIINQQELLTSRVDKQDKTIAENVKTLSEHTKTLSSQQKKEQEQDKEILKTLEQVAEHTVVLEKQSQRDEAIEKKVDENSRKIHKVETSLGEHRQAQEDANKVFERNITELKQEVNKGFDDLKNDVSQMDERTRNSIIAIDEKLNKQISCVETDLKQDNVVLEKKVDAILEELKSTIACLQNDVELNHAEVNGKIEELEKKITALDIVVNKKTWKIAISIVAGASLLLNLLQIIGII